jgi:hypothetical protein
MMSSHLSQDLLTQTKELDTDLHGYRSVKIHETPCPTRFSEVKVDHYSYGIHGPV